ncbi:U3 small nucleolar RNA-associated protein 21 homolog [Syzygium oleosum]|uniref:U3 small nucleolar RNA-associated protein 21 homolog n=1 Tax=Syzygium oleosum TaxID=219896 RepID=UPI0024BA64C9|nr:U3 small nucleolar RNA-associated protein 21 homolog [Syzygium oleosum]
MVRAASRRETAAFDIVDATQAFTAKVVDGEVVGVVCDSTNTLMVGDGYAGDIKVWDIMGRELKSSWGIGSSLICALAWMGNGSSSSMDGSLRIWDIILARQVDAVYVDVSITVLSLSPNMDILAITHVDQNGVYLWVNQSMFSGSSDINLYASGKEVVTVKLPSVSSVEGSQVEESNEPTIRHSESKDVPSFHPLLEQIPDLVTLSLLPKSQWQSLINLDIIKVRNKSIEPPKKPEKAPFFLPSIPSLSGEILFKPIETSDKGDMKADEDKSKITPEVPSSQFLLLLHSCSEAKNFSPFTAYIKGLSPSTLDLELWMLQIIDGYDDSADDDDLQDVDKRRVAFNRITYGLLYT